jgi:hypothetical protein
MEVWVQTKVLSPGMEQAHPTAFNPQVRISKLPISIPNSAEQLTAELFAVEQTNRVQFVWNGNNNVGGIIIS